MGISVDTRELNGMVKRLEMAGKATPKNIKIVLKTIGVIVLKKARDFSPMSMSKSQYVSKLKGKKTKRKVFTRGSLKQSITSEVKDRSVEIGVPSNSKAGAYAEKMHDDRGNSWNKLSIGKQPQSTDKYIYKAEEKTKKTYLKEVDKLIDRLIRGI